jgi:hypothetical protein
MSGKMKLDYNKQFDCYTMYLMDSRGNVLDSYEVDVPHFEVTDNAKFKLGMNNDTNNTTRNS